MDDNAAHYQRGLALSAGMLHGAFRMWRSLRYPWGELLRRLAADGRQEHDDEVFAHHGGTLLAMKLAVEHFPRMEAAEDARKVLISLMESQIEVVQAARTYSDEHIQRLADVTEDMTIFLIAFERLCVLAGLPNDPFGSEVE